MRRKEVTTVRFYDVVKKQKDINNNVEPTHTLSQEYLLLHM